VAFRELNLLVEEETKPLAVRFVWGEPQTRRVAVSRRTKQKPAVPLARSLSAARIASLTFHK
jgi:hypothetical protein